MIVLWVKTLAILTAAASMSLVGFRHREWRGGLLLLSCVFFAAAMNEFEWLFRPLFPMDEPELPPIVFFLFLGVVLAWCNRGTTVVAFRAICKNRRFPLLVWGLCLVSFLPQLGTDKHVWAALLPAAYSTHEARKLVEHGIEFLGCLFLLNWAILFLKDKWRILIRRMPSPREHLLREQPWERVGKGGSRRICYKLGDSGFCVKFYKPEELCAKEQRRKKKCAGIQREIRKRRFDVQRNSSSREVEVYEKFWMRQPAAIREKLPPVVERVFDEKLGWGILETYYTNPDGTAIIPYEFEIMRQTSVEKRREIYNQAKALLEELAQIAAPFYEPGNFHTLIRPDGGIETKLIDFEPISKMAIPFVKFCPWLRRLTIRRKARKYLKHIRGTYDITE